MKRLFILTALFITANAFIAINGSSQNNVNKTVHYNAVAQKPSFQGGDINDFSKWVKANLDYPESAKKNSVEGIVYLNFIVDIDGSIRDVKVICGIDPDIDREAKRVVSSSPKWVPGKDSNGKPIRVLRTNFPVSFNLKSAVPNNAVQTEGQLSRIMAKRQVTLRELYALRDIEWNIIKNSSNPSITGLTAHISYYIRETYEEWGETKYKRKWYKSEVLNKGLSIFSYYSFEYRKQKNDPLNGTDIGSDIRLCLYNTAGVLTEVRYYRADNPVNNEALDNSTLFSFKNQELYEYDSSNRIKSITFKDYQQRSDVWGPSRDAMHICKKEYQKWQLGGVCKIIYKYHNNGPYEVFGCYPDGSTAFHNIIDRYSVTGESGNMNHAWTLDEKGQVLAIGSGLTANGVHFDEYYGYNKSGDLVVESSRSDVTNVSEPWLSEKYRDGRSKFYKYKYDSRNNWVLQEELGLDYMSGDMEVRKTVERKIDYKD